MRILFEKRTSKRVISTVLAVLCLTSGFYSGGSFKALIILCGSIFILGFLRLEVRGKHILRGIYVTALVIVPVATFFIGQIMQDISFFSVPFIRVILNIVIVLILQFVALLISKSLRLSLTLGCVVPTLATLANTYVFRFRGNALMFSDLLSIRTAANVAAEYDFTPTPPMLYAVILAAILMLGVYCLPPLSVPRTKGNIGGQAGAILLCIAVLLLGSAQQRAEHWNNDGAVYNGYLLNFILQIKEVFVSKPEGYEGDSVELLEMQYTGESTEYVLHPDIIVIMDESFADFSVFGNNLFSSEDITSFINSMQDNTIQGYLYASVFGGGTPNSEYELLSGNTMAFLPFGSIPYQQFISEGAYSLVSVLKEQGYDCIAMHPYYANGWMRNTVYPMMGFDETYFLDDFPQENLIREYVSDQEMFEEIIRLHQQQDENTPLFLFGVTMQNHGGYTYEGPNYEPTITLEGYSQEYPEAEQYLSLIHETDTAVEYLIEYFSSIDRDVVIVFYGDHMPKVENAFYEELNGGAFDTLDEQMRKQMVPFFIWANYDIEEKEIPCSSINYLSTYVLEAAGIPLPPYQQFLKETERLIPAINAYGYYSLEKQGFTALEEATGAEKEAIHAYEILQYNSMFDEENRSVHFFGN